MICYVTGETDTFARYLWECEFLQPLGRRVWQYLHMKNAHAFSGQERGYPGEGSIDSQAYGVGSSGAGGILSLDLGTGHIACCICENSFMNNYIYDALFGTYVTF